MDTTFAEDNAESIMLFDGWSVNLMTELFPISPHGYRHILLAVDCFFKWTELVPLRMKDSF